MHRHCSKSKRKDWYCGLRQMGRGSSSILQAQAPAVAAIEFKFSYPGSTSDQAFTCEREETAMRKQCSATIKSGVTRISIAAKFRLTSILLVAALLVSGYGDGFSPSTLAHNLSWWKG
jgi:hypothetical protein